MVEMQASDSTLITLSQRMSELEASGPSSSSSQPMESESDDNPRTSDKQHTAAFEAIKSIPTSNWSSMAKRLCIDSLIEHVNDHHAEPNDKTTPSLPSSAAYQSFLLSEVSGALGDIGTYIPILVSLSNTSQINLTASLVFGGFFHIVVALVYQIPVRTS